MAKRSTNPWVKRFDAVLDRNVVYQRAYQSVEPLDDLGTLSPEDAEQALSNALKRLYVPTAQALDLLENLVARARAHSAVAYTDVAQYLNVCYSQNDPKFDPPWPQCLTGLAGVGKSALFAALERVLPPECGIKLDENHSTVDLSAVWHVRVESRATLRSLLYPLAHPGQPETGRPTNSELKHDARWRAYRDGVSLVVADELQFQSRAQNANALVTTLLATLMDLGRPAIFAANYSLCHRLLKRPQEDRQRLLSDPIVLTPDVCDGDWIAYLAAVKAVAPEQLCFDPEADAEEIHRYSAGIRRLVRMLLTLAYRLRRESGHLFISAADVSTAYHSTAFTANREDVKAIISQSITGTTKRLDLKCPFDLPKSQQLQFTKQAHEAYGRRISLEMLKASMTAAEREALNRLEQSAALTKSNEGEDNVVSIKRSPRPTAADLLDAAREFETRNQD